MAEELESPSIVVEPLFQEEEAVKTKHAATMHKQILQVIAV